MLVVFWPAFLSGEDLFLSDVGSGVVFLLETLWDSEAQFVIVPLEARLLVTLGVGSVSLMLGVVVLVYIQIQSPFPIQ